MGDTIGNVAADAVGIVGAPFTGGASLLLPAALNVGEGIASGNPLQAILGAGTGALGAFGIPGTDITGFLDSGGGDITGGLAGTAGSAADSVGSSGSILTSDAAANSALASDLGVDPTVLTSAYGTDAGVAAAAGSTDPATFLSVPGAGASTATDLTSAASSAAAPSAGSILSGASPSVASSIPLSATSSASDLANVASIGSSLGESDASLLSGTATTGSFWGDLTSGNLSNAWSDLTGSGSGASGAGTNAGSITLPDGTTINLPGAASSKGGISGTSLALGALAALGSALGKTANNPSATLSSANAALPSSTSLQNTPLNTSGYINRTPISINEPSSYWQTYGENPAGEQLFFANNQLGYRRGGALTARRPPAEGPVRGPGDGVSDSEPAMLSDGEYVLTARDVAAIGNGSNDAGARRLDEMRRLLHRDSGTKKMIAPRVTKSPLQYLREASGARR